MAIRPPSSGGNGRMFTRARLADRMPITYRVITNPAPKKMSEIWVAIPIGPDTCGGAVGSLITWRARSPRPPRITPNQRTVSLAPTPIAVGRSRVYVP